MRTVGGIGVGVYKRQPTDNFKKQRQSSESQGADKPFTIFQIGLPTGCQLDIAGATSLKTPVASYLIEYCIIYEFNSLRQKFGV